MRFPSLPWKTVAAWSALIAPLGALWLAAATFEKSDWPTLVGDEAVYLMAAQSLAHDLDLLYAPADLARFEEQVSRRPDGLILQSPDGGSTLVYGKPLVYPLAIAPFLRLSPDRGAPLANAFYLTLTALLCAWCLRRVVRWKAPIFVSCFLFGSIAFAHTFWAHSDLFQMCLVGSGLALVLEPWLRTGRLRRLDSEWTPPTETPTRLDAWLVALGCVLLALAVMARPFHLPLLAVPLVAWPRGSRGLVALGAIAATLATVVGVNLAVRGEWSSYTGERRAYYSYLGFPGDGAGGDGISNDGTGNDGTGNDGTGESWQERVSKTGGNSWTGDGFFPFPFQVRQTSWNVLYFFLGRHTGIVPYFLPFLLGLFAFRSDRVNWTLVLALTGVVALFLVARPFNYYGGGGALANRYFLPVYPLCWFLVRRPISLGWPALLMVVAAPFLIPSWTGPGSFWREPDGAFHHVSRAAERWLPYESTQSQLKPSDREDFHYQLPDGGALWMKPLSPRVSSPDEGETLLVGPGERNTEVLVASPERLRSFRIEVEGQPPRVATFDGASARHRMWWSLDQLYLYRFALLDEDAGEKLERQRQVRVSPLAVADAR